VKLPRAAALVFSISLIDHILLLSFFLSLFLSLSFFFFPIIAVFILKLVLKQKSRLILLKVQYLNITARLVYVFT